MKPFKTPIPSRKPSEGTAALSSGEPPAKKRRISDHNDHSGDDEAGVIAAAANALKSRSVPPFRAPAPRKPLDVIPNPAASSQSGGPDAGAEGYFAVLWRRFTTKKHKTWDGDGVLSVTGRHATLQDIDGKVMGRGATKGPLLIGSELSIGGKDIEVEAMISKADFLAGRPFLGNTNTKASAAPAPSLREIDGVGRVTNKAQARQEKIAAALKYPSPTAVRGSIGTTASFKAPTLANHVQTAKKDSAVPIPRHDPNGENALVMKRPKHAPPGKQIVDVVVDPLLTAKLRDHQRAGVAFLYECVMDMKGYGGEGAILADEMGLGKTLQTIALLWTLLKQTPIYQSPPVIKKALIVCPVTLINNWRREIYKWLGKERIGVFVAEDKKTRLTDFTKGRSYSIMIIGYEKLRTVQAELQDGGIDIVIADEGHRLKTAQNKSAQAIKSLNTTRRIVLSGTPIQNDLAEFYTMVDFVNPGLLNKYTNFKRSFEMPILKSQQPGASAKELEIGEGRSTELAELTGKFILRRTAEILSRYLPQKTEYVVFCRPTGAQASVYRAIISSPTFNAALSSPAISLELINVLKKVCNSPSLLQKKNEKGESATKPELLEGVPQSLLKTPGGGKLQVLDSLLHRIRSTTEEKVVLVSNYTSTMDVLASLLNALEYKYLRLDGATPPGKRQGLVDRFNRLPAKDLFVFLLSAKAGGTGLNLIGASRLVLFDLDWNPATDLQAMARVHRDGQKRPCSLYRMVTQGALDEKIFQRQVSKTGLADSIVDGKSATSTFTKDELRDLFSLDESSECQTHELLGCKCSGDGLLSLVDDEECLPERNDLASLSEEIDEADGPAADEVEVVRMDLDSDDEPIVLPKKRRFKTGNQVDWKAQEAEIERKARERVDTAGRTKMLSLMQYTHFDTALVKRPAANTAPVNGRCDVDDDASDGETPEVDALESAIEDEALRAVIREDGCKIGFVFAKTSS
ncbi:helicase [Teratosphaeriaceae sp. CCFEE 6253]|nr:helicase [Teratosphaeriaceae sp. CCFEE 6253]